MKRTKYSLAAVLGVFLSHFILKSLTIISLACGKQSEGPSNEKADSELTNSSSLLFDPGEVVTTNRLKANMDMGRPMLNNYIRHAKVGGGQHGEVYLCYKVNPRLAQDNPESRFPVVSVTYVYRRIIPVQPTLLKRV